MRGNALPAAPQTQALTIFIPCHQLPHRYLSYRELTLILSSVVMRFGGKLKVKVHKREGCTRTTNPDDVARVVGFEAISL